MVLIGLAMLIRALVQFRTLALLVYFTNSYGVHRYENGSETFLYKAQTDIVLYTLRAATHLLWLMNQAGYDYYILKTVNSGATWDTIFYRYDDIYGFYNGYGEWWDAGSISNGSTTFSRFMDWNTGVMAYLDSSGSKEFVTTNGGTSWDSLPDSTSSIISTKISPSGELFCLRGSYFSYSLWKYNGHSGWQFISKMDLEFSLLGIGAQPDFDWSWDGIYGAFQIRMQI